MITPEDVWSRLDSLAREQGLTPSGLAKAAGLDATTFNPSRRAGLDGALRWPSMGSLLRALDVLGVHLATFAAQLPGGASPLIPQAEGVSPTPLLPSLPLSHLGQAGLFDKGGCPTGAAWEDVEAPFGFTAPAYVVRIDTACLEPVLREGASAVVLPVLEARARDRVLLLQPGQEAVAGVLLAGAPPRLAPLSAAAGGVPLLWNTAENVWLHRIVMTTL